MKRLKKNILIVTTNQWNQEAGKEFIAQNPQWDVKLITDRKKFSCNIVRKFNPAYIFFPHWSWLIPESIYQNYECIVFHMTDLPFGRGGSPLQNLIERGIRKTKISAIRVIKELDAGPIYLKQPLSLNGPAKKIFKKISKIIFQNMIPYIIENKPVPVFQKGRVVRFKRRIPEQSNISRLRSTRKIYDYIRMLDAKGYPSAFIETPYLKVEFLNARLKGKKVFAQTKISLKERR